MLLDVVRLTVSVVSLILSACALALVVRGWKK